MIAHLGMSGALRIFPSPYEAVKHDHVLFELSSGKTLAFRDPRRFGLLSLCNHEEISTHRLFANLGPEPFAKDISADFLLQRLAKKKQPIKIAIMDQSLIVGVGNIYASEALFRARIHPLRAAGEITKEEMQKLLTEIRSVLAAAIASGGSTLRDYVRSDGELGYFQHHFDVYGKAREACVICAAPIEVIRLGGRSSFFCSNCQK
jgi:formamidopyrimidine-DNA glycosylase